jgi:hypothetical protein
MYIYLLYYEDAREEDFPDEFLIGVYSNTTQLQKAAQAHADFFNTNNGEPLDWSASNVVTDAQPLCQYFCIGKELDEITKWGMHCN